MIRAPQLEPRRPQDDSCITRRWSEDAASQARGRIELDAFRRGTTITDMLHEMLARALSEDGAAS
jgi:hypothetical protein